MTLGPHETKPYLCSEYYYLSIMPFSGNSVQNIFKKREKMATFKLQ